jgi:putative ABC transport system permease protein
LRQLHRIQPGAEDDFTVVDPVAAMEAEASILDSLRLVLGAIAALSLVVGGITIANVLLVAVKERTREIGIRLAVGARPAVIRRQFLVEATVLSTLGGIAGVAVGLALAAVLAAALAWPLTVEGEVVALALVVAAATGVGAGWYPSLRAAETDPIAALRVE